MSTGDRLEFARAVVARARAHGARILVNGDGAMARAAGADVTAVHDKAEIPEVIAGMAKPGDLVLTMGAGDVTDLGPRILDRLPK